MNFLLSNKKSVILILIAILGTVFLMQEKQYDNDFYKSYLDKKNKEMQDFDLSEKLIAIAYSYSQDNNLSKIYRNTMYDCLGSSIYKGKENSLLSSTLQACKEDYINLDKKAIYYNQAWLMRDFSQWDGSYILLERIIKKHIKAKESYKMRSVSHKMVFEDKRPHMYVQIDYTAANLGGRMYEKSMSIKVDAKTKELYDLR
ncbi:MAG: hypothetical protein Q9M32_02070 [Sulfurimonas sp.]|nr:hypothetical protein [Sulfurimonas sp.]MDQ7060382.1 hypothetical protein [Sulfurimonas sp.]